MKGARAVWLDLESGRLERLEPSDEWVTGCVVFAATSLPGADELRARLHQSGCGPRSLIWIAPDGQLVVLSVDAQGVVDRTAQLTAGGLTIHIPAGCRIELSADGAVVGQVSVTASGGQIRLGSGDLRVSAGRLEFDAAFDAPAVDAWVRYFYGPEPKGLRYRVFTGFAGKTLRLHAAVDPSRPYDPAHNSFTLQANETFATNFATPLAKRIYLTTLGDRSRFVPQYDPAEKSSYFVLDGDWQASVAPGAPLAGDGMLNLMCGLSGVEFAKVRSGSVMRFRSGRPAYAPSFGSPGVTGTTLLTDKAPGSPYPVTTSWLTFADDGPMGLAAAAAPGGYYAQPQSSSFYTPGAGPTFLEFLEIRAANFPAGTGSFPMAPYLEVQEGPLGSLAEYRAFEIAVMGPARRNAIVGEAAIDCSQPGGPSGLGKAAWALGTGPTCPTAPPGTGPTKPTGPTGPSLRAATPQGLLAEFSEKGDEWWRLTLAEGETPGQTLRFTEIRGAMRSALLTNQVFLVVTDPVRFLDNGSINYQLTQQSYADLRGQAGVPYRVVEAVRYLQGILYESRDYFEHVLKIGLGECDYNLYKDAFLKYAASAELVLNEWHFRVSPYEWEANGTVLILKYAERTIEELVDDLLLWTLPGSFNINPCETQKKLKQFIANAKEKAKSEPDFRYFAETVISGKQPGGGEQAWNGVLFLNCAVPLTQLPAQLQGLAAGIKPADFRAHHVGIEASSIEYQSGTGVLRIKDTSLFGLIFYEDLIDQEYSGDPYEFKVQSLKVLFQNSQISNFASTVQLLVGALFGELSSLPDGPHGSNLLLNGTYQKHGLEESYVFLQESNSVFTVTSHVLSSVEIARAQFLTVLSKNELSPNAEVQTRFLMWGSLRFQALEGLDVFAFGPGFDAEGNRDFSGDLRYANLSVGMTFDPQKVTDPGFRPTFRFDATQIAFDLSQSRARPRSLYQRFPLAVSAFVQAKEGSTPADLGYIPVDSPLPQGSLSFPWFALEMDLSLGSPGGLAAKTGFYAKLLAAWAPNVNNASVFVGLKLPGSDGQKEITIQGPLKLSMSRIALLVSKDEQQRAEAYLMRFSNIALSFLSLKFPPAGQTNVLLFGDPDPQSASSTLGWYAAYKKDEKTGATGPAGGGLVRVR